MSKWEKVKLGDVSSIQGGYAFKSNEFVKNQVPVIRIGNLNGETVDLDYEISFHHEFWENNEVYRVKEGDILIAMSGATVGKMGRFSYDEPALLNQRVGLTTRQNKSQRKLCLQIHQFWFVFCSNP